MISLYRVTTIQEFQRGLLYENGRYVRTLGPGRHRFWNWFVRREVAVVDVRRQVLQLAGQEVLTADHVPVRLTMAVDYQMIDPVAAAHEVENWYTQLYSDVQLALRELVAALTFDQTLDQRSALSDQLLTSVKERAARYGIDIQRIAIRDVTMPASIREMMLKSVEAERSAQASLIRAREEVAAARARANAAKLIAENPAVLRLKELETLSEFAKSGGHTIVFSSGGELANVLRKTS